MLVEITIVYVCEFVYISKQTLLNNKANIVFDPRTQQNMPLR